LLAAVDENLKPTIRRTTEEEAEKTTTVVMKDYHSDGPWSLGALTKSHS
jgi:hypothetical protein